MDLEGKSGVFIAAPAEAPQGTRGGEQGQKALTAKFLPVQTGIRDGENVEIIAGLRDGTQVITTGSGALKDGDRIVAAGGERSGRGPSASGRGGRGEGRGSQPEGSSR